MAARATSAPKNRPFADTDLILSLESTLIRLVSELGVANAGQLSFALEHVCEYALRPGKRIRPYFCALGWRLQGLRAELI